MSELNNKFKLNPPSPIVFSTAGGYAYTPAHGRDKCDCCLTPLTASELKSKQIKCNECYHKPMKCRKCGKDMVQDVPMYFQGGYHTSAWYCPICQ